MARIINCAPKSVGDGSLRTASTAAARSIAARRIRITLGP
jgi:hypothetical protein